MSVEDVERLRSAYQAFLEGDIEAALAIVDEQIEVFEHERSLDTPKSYRGPQGLLAMAAEAAESFDEHRYEPQEFIDGGDRVLVEVQRKGRGTASGVEVDEWQGHVWTFRDGKAVRFEAFVDKAAARETAGLSD